MLEHFICLVLQCLVLPLHVIGCLVHLMCILVMCKRLAGSDFFDQATPWCHMRCDSRWPPRALRLPC